MSKKNKMLLLSLILMLVMSIVVVGCGGTTEPEPESQDEPADEKGEVVEESADEKVMFPAEGDFVPGNSITFSWEDTEGAENYRIRIVRQSDGTVFYNRLTESPESSYTVSNFSDDGEIYCWQVSALDGEGWSDWSDNNCFTNSEPL